MKISPVSTLALVALPLASYLITRTNFAAGVQSLAKSLFSSTPTSTCPVALPASFQALANRGLNSDSLRSLIDADEEKLYAPKGLVCEGEEPMRQLYISEGAVAQAMVANCGLAATLKAVASTDPAQIAKIITSVKPDVWGVTLHDNAGKPVNVHVTAGMLKSAHFGELLQNKDFSWPKVVAIAFERFANQGHMQGTKTTRAGNQPSEFLEGIYGRSVNVQNVEIGESFPVQTIQREVVEPMFVHLLRNGIIDQQGAALSPAIMGVRPKHKVNHDLMKVGGLQFNHGYEFVGMVKTPEGKLAFQLRDPRPAVGQVLVTAEDLAQLAKASGFFRFEFTSLLNSQARV